MCGAAPLPWAHELPLLLLLRPTLSKEPFRWVPWLPRPCTCVRVHRCLETHTYTDQRCHPFCAHCGFAACVRTQTPAAVSAQNPVVGLDYHLPLSDCSEGASGSLEDDVAPPGRRNRPWRAICIYLGSKCLCLVLAQELYGLTHVLVRGQRELPGRLGHTHGVSQSKQ